MGCNCGKNKGASAARRTAPAAAASRKAPVRRVRRPRPTMTAREMPTQASPRPANRLHYYVIAPDGTEERYNTLAEAQTVIRRHGHTSGYRIESRRETS